MRYIVKRAKINRKFGEPILGFTKALKKKPYPPGQHGNGRRPKRSPYALQLAQKQKAKYTYGIPEKQFYNLYKEAQRRTGITGHILLQLCESRLDNVVYRLGMAPTRASARQLVRHRHVMVNGKRNDIPSCALKPEDVVAPHPKSVNHPVIKQSQANAKYEWLAWNQEKLTGKYIQVPERAQIPENIDEQSIVELYSK